MADPVIIGVTTDIIFSSDGTGDATFTPTGLESVSLLDTRTPKDIPEATDILRLHSTFDGVEEGEDFTIVCKTSDLTAERNPAFTITGIRAEDLGLTSLQGEFNLVETVENGVTILQDSIDFNVLADDLLEGDETFVIKLDADETEITKIRVSITDTSRGVKDFYSLGKDPVRTEFFDNGDFTISIDASESVKSTGGKVEFFIDGPVSQWVEPTDGDYSFSVGLDGKASKTFSKVKLPDTNQIGDLFFSLRLVDNVNTKIEFPIYKNKIPPLYELFADNFVVREGDSFTVNLYTSGIAENTVIPYTITGIEAADISQSLTGTFTVDADGFASATFSVVEDLVQEGSRTFRLRLDNGQARVFVTIEDTTPRDDIVIPTDKTPNLSTGTDNRAYDYSGFFYKMVEELTNVKDYRGEFGRVATALEGINHSLKSMSQDSITISRTLMGMRDDVARLRNLMDPDEDGQGVRTTRPYSEMVLPSLYKSIIAEGGALDLDTRFVLSDSDVERLLSDRAALPNTQLKGESIKKTQDVMKEIRKNFGGKK